MLGKITNNEQRYFPNMESSTSLEILETSVPDEQIEIFKNLVELIACDPHFHLDLKNGQFESTKDALAFYVEAAKQLYKEEWKTQLNEVMRQILNIRETATDPEQAYKSTTWLLNKLITNLYEVSIQTKHMKASYKHNKKEADFCQITMDSIKSLYKRCRFLEEHDNSVGLGGIHRSLLPKWYLKNFIFSAEGPPKSLSKRSITKMNDTAG